MPKIKAMLGAPLMVITNNVVAALTLNKKNDFEVVLASGYMRKSSNGLVG